MKRRILVLFAGGLLLVLVGTGRVFAHHSFAATYVAGKRVEVEGVVKEFIWRNPHSFLRIDVTAADGTVQTWTLEWGSVGQLSRYNLTRTSLHVGDRVIVIGDAARETSSLRLRIESVTRPLDGWSWKGQVD